MSAVPDQIARRWLAGKLADPTVTAAGSTGAYKHPAPDTAAEPFVTVAGMTERSIGPIGKQAAEVYALTMLIRVWDAGASAARADAIAGAIHALINKRGPENVSGGSLVSCRRISGVPFSSIIEAGVTYQISGGEYELLVTLE